ncbi:fimbrial assembly protein [Arsenophonus sp.]|uniref:fimbrial assembly protein n=1 Tax=Arsenophonus sp. TaxID=1872640 RepID=UPI003879AA38
MIRISIINILLLVGLLIGCTSINKDVDIAIVTRTQLGIAYLSAGNYPAASYHFKKIMLAEPKNGIANLGMAVIMRQQKQPDLALKYFKVAIRSSAINNTSMRYYYLDFLCSENISEEIIKLRKEEGRSGLNCQTISKVK